MTDHVHPEGEGWDVFSAGDAVGVLPGDTCDRCNRRVPHPKKETSPKTRPLAYRIPLDEADAHLEVIDAVAELLGVGAEKYHRYRAISYAMAVVLQGGRLEETGE